MKHLALVSLCFLLSAASLAQTYSGDRQEIDEILRQSAAFSKNYVSGDMRGLSEIYTEDGKILPAGSEIIKGRDAIAERFRPKDGYIVSSHSVTSEEINVLGEFAYDYGYYEGALQNTVKEVFPFKGKYVIIWKKINDVWYIYADIRNSVNED